MCGISGIINKNNKSISANEIKLMNDLVKHRGPDDEGYFFELNFSLGHRRLSILDLSSLGHQPMEFNAKYVIVYNGEIYNYLELRNDLLKDDYRFKTDTDTEVVLAAYDRWGESCIQRFNGMWSFALYDRKKNILFCSRDRFGVKPFYYAEVEKKFVFGSEIKQLLVYFSKRYVNKKILIDYIATGIQEHNNETFFEGIYKLGPGHNLIYDLSSHEHRIYRYYHLRIDKELARKNEVESISKYKEQLIRGIEIRLRSDVKVGTCLSGGMDSSSVATLASGRYRRDSNERFNAITAKSTDRRLDESSFAHKVVNHADLTWNVIEPTFDDFKENLDEVVRTQEEPFGSTSIFMQYFVMKKAREIGCTVMLDGQGGDETLLGYEKYYPAAYIEYYRANGLRETIKEINNSRKNNSKMSLKWILIYTIGSLFSNLRKAEYRRRCNFLKREYWHNFDFLDELARKYFDINQLQIYEIESTNLPVLLRYEDKNSMRHSVEARLPYIDYETLETALSLNIKYKIKNGWSKYILRMALENEMPGEVIWRKNKIGFNAPEKQWLDLLRSDMLETINRSKILGKVAHMDKLNKKFGAFDTRLQWRIYNIAKWEELFHVEIN